MGIYRGDNAMNESKELVYLIDGPVVEKCEIVRRTEMYAFIKRGKTEYKIHKSKENSDYFYHRNGGWDVLFFYKPNKNIEKRYERYCILKKLDKIGYDIYRNSGPLDGGPLFHMIQRMKEFIALVETNKDLFREDDLEENRLKEVAE
jgi:hypothetical protein